MSRNPLFNENTEISHIYKAKKETANLSISPDTNIKRDFMIPDSRTVDIISEDFDPFMNKKELFCTDKDIEMMQLDLMKFGSNMGIRYEPQRRKEDKPKRGRRNDEMELEEVPLDGLFRHKNFPMSGDSLALVKNDTEKYETFRKVFSELNRSTFVYVNLFLVEMLQKKFKNKGKLIIHADKFISVAAWNHLTYKSHCKRFIEGTEKELVILTFIYNEGEFRELRDTVFIVHLALEELKQRKKRLPTNNENIPLKDMKKGDNINGFVGNFYSFMYDMTIHKSYVLRH